MASAPSAPSSERAGARRVDPGPYGTAGRAEWLDIDWREHLRWVETPDGWVNVCDYGSGDGMPAVLIHGHSGCWQNWLENIPALGRDRRVLAVDLPGFGESPLWEAEVTISRYAGLVDGVCEALGIERAAMIGNSMGGFVAADVAIHHDTRVDRLALVAAAGLSSRYLGFLSPRIMSGRALGIAARAANRFARIDPQRDPFFRRPRSRALGARMVFRHPEQLAPELLAQFMLGTGRPAFTSAITAIGGYDFRDLVGGIRCPTLIVWGEDDRVIPFDAAHEYGRLIPHAEKVVFPDTGHCPMAERPAAFNTMVAEFLS